MSNGKASEYSNSAQLLASLLQNEAASCVHSGNKLLPQLKVSLGSWQLFAAESMQSSKHKWQCVKAPDKVAAAMLALSKLHRLE